MEEVRRVTIDVVVDTGAGPLVITEAMRQRLGLEIERTDSVYLADGAIRACALTEAVRIIWKDRYTSSHPIVLPAGQNILLGVIPLEDMDVMANPVDRCLVGAHGSEWRHYVL
jgi:clan AA aspartic protease